MIFDSMIGILNPIELYLIDNELFINKDDNSILNLIWNKTNK